MLYKQLRPFLSICIVMSLAMCGLSEYYVLDLNSFSLTILKKWKYNKQKGIDSFVGRINTGKNTLHFDFSSQGYANFGIDTEKEYLESKIWLSGCPFCEFDVTYTDASDLKAVRADLMKERGITNTNLVKVRAYIEPEIKSILPDPKNRKKYPSADYFVELAHQDSIFVVPIFIPEEIKAHNILMDTTAAYITKTVWPKQIGKGTTGIFIRARHNRLTFNLVGQNLNKFDQEEALKAFKTIKIRNEE